MEYYAESSLMEWYPLGLLALLGLLILLIIYILKPNYQQKFVSSTHVWKLSLRYKRKKVPFNLITNLLIVICQIMIISISAFAVTTPLITEAIEPDVNEQIFVLDASVNMLAHQGDSANTRFDRGIERIRELGQGYLSNLATDYSITLVVASNPVEVPFSGIRNVAELNYQLDSLRGGSILVEADGTERFVRQGYPPLMNFAGSDINEAMRFAEEILAVNPLAEVHLVTATEFNQPSSCNVNIINIAQMDSNTYTGNDLEWNAAILNVNVRREGFFVFEVEIAVFGIDANVPVQLVLWGINDTDDSVQTRPVVITERALADGTPVTVVFDTGVIGNGEGEFEVGVFEFHRAQVSLLVQDSFSYDNVYEVFGGRRETIRILYASPLANRFYFAMLGSLRYALADRYHIEFEIYSLAEMQANNRLLTGFDLYIFEYEIPRELPMDGASLLIYGGPVMFNNREIAPINGGFTVDPVLRNNIHRVPAQLNRMQRSPSYSSQLLHRYNLDNVYVNRHRRLMPMHDEFRVLTYVDYGGVLEPAIMLRNTQSARIAVKAFSSFFTNHTLNLEFPVLIYNLINLFFPPTLTSSVFDIGETVTFAQSEAVMIETNRPATLGYAGTHTNIVLPYHIVGWTPGIRYLRQTISEYRPASQEHFFVRIPEEESNFLRIAEFNSPMVPPPDRLDFDIYIILAALLLGFIVLERVLSVMKNM